ncbi:MAG: multicopper oxidase domain-containing protein, partial [Alicyclobacillus sp.]|nr:multicopper oxidase domain-containing protein [Alicyclobacillus sp.]
MKMWKKKTRGNLWTWGAVTLIATGLTAALAGCGHNVQAPQPTTALTGIQGFAQTVTVHMGNMAFLPTTLHVAPGTTVVWNNNDNIAHTVTSGANRVKDGRFDSDDLQPGKTFSYTFTKPGTYPYYCVYHPNMKGTVVVDSPPQTPVPQAEHSMVEMHMENSAGAPNPSTTVYSIAPLGTGTAGEPKQADALRLLPYTMQNGYKVFHLKLKPVYWQTQPNAKQVEAWAFNGSVPGPEIKVNQGDKVMVVVDNELPEATSVHWHGLDVPFAEDGVGGLTQPDIQPGKSWISTFTVNVPPGAYMYHAHPMNDMLKQESMGAFGPFIVEPQGTGWQQVHPGYQEEYTLMLNDSSQFGYTINGLSYPAAPVLPAQVGDNVLVHLINIGDMNHPMHSHGMHFQEIGQDGFPLPNPVTMDTIDTAPGTTYDLAFHMDQPG